MNSIFLSGDRILLRALSFEDLKGNYLNWLNDSVICSGNSHHVFPYTENSGREYIESVNKSRRELVLAVILKKNEIHIGNISLININFMSQNAELALLFGEREYWGKGFAKEASSLILDHGFNALNLHRIYCGTFSTNTGMSKLALSLGMKQEGLRRDAYYKDGQFVDIIEYGLLKSEFIVKANDSNS